MSGEGENNLRAAAGQAAQEVKAEGATALSPNEERVMFYAKSKKEGWCLFYTLRDGRICGQFAPRKSMTFKEFREFAHSQGAEDIEIDPRLLMGYTIKLVISTGA